MLQITIPEREFFDSQKQEFVYLKEQKITLEHSLISISKWESKWKKPFLDTGNKTYEESIDYLRCMTLTPNVDPDAYKGITTEIFGEISKYIDDTMTATWFNERNHSGNRGRSTQVVTSELIYYWMIAYNIPFECQKWHLNRLLTLIKVCDIKNAPSKKMKKKDVYARNRALNAERRRNLGTNG